MRSRVPVSIAVGVVALAIAQPAAAVRVADAGALTASASSDPWALQLTRAGGAKVLDEYPGTGSSPSGTLGFRTAGGVWHHATRALNLHVGRNGKPSTARLETDDPTHRIDVQIGAGGAGVISLKADLVGPSGDVDAIGIAFRSRTGERYMGFGERSNAVDQRGNVVEDYSGEGAFQPDERAFVPNAFVPNWGFRGRDDGTYFPMPWLLSSAGYGVLLGNTQTSYFRLETDRPDAWSIEVTKAPSDYPQSVTGPAPTSLELRFFAGPTPAGVLRRLTREIGRQPPPAPWFLGPWYQPREDKTDAPLLRKADSPVSVAQTYTHYLPCGAQQGQTAAQRQRTRFFHSLGYAITTYFNPMICTAYSPVYDQAAGAGALTETAAGNPYVYRYNQFVVSQFDFTGEAGRDFYGNLLAEAADNGYDGWMEDFGEYAPLDGKSADGTDGTVLHNLYPKVYHCAANAAVSDFGRPILRFIRSGWTGAAACAPVVWGGDPTTGWGFDGLRSAVQNGLTMGLSGVGVWGSDIGGFFSLFDNSLSPELLRRWVQLGSVSGVMRTEADGFAIPEKPRPQVFDKGELANWRRYSKLRTQLYPYIRAAAATYAATGMPIMRQLALAYPRDPAATSREDEFLFGPDLLAAPVLEPGATKRKLYLPRGRWVDVWRSVRYRPRTGAFDARGAHVLSGHRQTTLPAPADELPLLARAGALLPMLPPDVDTLSPYGKGHGLVHFSDRAGRMRLLAFPRGRSAARMNEGERLRSREMRGRRWRLRIQGTRTRRWTIEASTRALRHPFAPRSVLVDGRPLPRRGWSYRRDAGVLTVRARCRACTLLVGHNPTTGS